MATMLGDDFQSLGNIYANAFYATSDIQLKDNIKDISDSIREFTWKDSGQKSYGLIAQELEEKYPELIMMRDDGYKTVNYDAAICMLIAKLENKIKEQEERIIQLEKERS